MTLGDTQREFARHLGYLLRHIEAAGYQCTLGDAFRDPRSHGHMGVMGVYGRAKSAHKQRLAIDLNLFKGGEYLSTTEDHRPIGEYWKALHEDNRWGGDFDFDGDGHGDDGNHYSKWYGGIA